MGHFPKGEFHQGSRRQDLSEIFYNERWNTDLWHVEEEVYNIFIWRELLLCQLLQGWEEDIPQDTLIGRMDISGILTGGKSRRPY